MIPFLQMRESIEKLSDFLQLVQGWDLNSELLIQTHILNHSHLSSPCKGNSRESSSSPLNMSPHFGFMKTYVELEAMGQWFL